MKVIHPRYLKANKKKKTEILNEFIASTGYNRKYAIRVLKQGPQPGKMTKRESCRKIYRGEVVEILIQIWELMGRICSKRLKPYLPEIVEVLERCNELKIAPETKALLLKMSCSTIDRCLKPERFKSKKRGLSTTKPGTLLKNAIPIQTYTKWDETVPGFVEIDLVAHCGESTAGQYLNTLTVTDIATGWTECLGILHRSQEKVTEAMIALRQRLPFPLLGIDSDNGSEFINQTLFKYCQDEGITFTRCRPYRKNDQAHVEQKNWSVVRRLIGYERYETEEELETLQTIYNDWRLFVNFFQPVLKIVSKERIGSKVKKQYDTASTPYRRALTFENISTVDKARLINTYFELNPVSLRNNIDDNVGFLWKIIR
jgi:hypothetical protein